MNSYTKVIVNPAAGAGKTAKEWPRIMSLFQQHGLRFEHELTGGPGHAVELARLAALDSYDMVVSVGGDGTINEIVNGIYTSGNIQNTTLGIISTGTGGDYIRTLGVPRCSDKACQILLQPKKRTVDLGIVEYTNNGQMIERVFANFAGMGFDAEIVKRTTQQFKMLGSLSSYLIGALITVLTYRNRNIILSVDGEDIEKKVCTVIMNNGCYGGGGMFTAPNADIDDGLFDVLIIGDLSKPDLLYSLPRIYKGTHLSHPKVTLKKAREIEIRSTQPMPLQADGELLGEVPARFRVLPSVLNVVV